MFRRQSGVQRPVTSHVRPPHFEIKEIDPESFAARAMFEQLDQHNRTQAEAGRCCWASLKELKQPNHVVLGVWIGPQLCGIGAIAHERDYSELKRMYVDPEFRGQGLADALLEALQNLALRAGHKKICLETSPRFFRAVAFYTLHGFFECAPFGKYTERPVNMYMMKSSLPELGLGGRG